MRGLKRLRCAQVVCSGHAFVQHLRRGHYELGHDIEPGRRLEAIFTELALVILNRASIGRSLLPPPQRNSAGRRADFVSSARTVPLEDGGVRPAGGRLIWRQRWGCWVRRELARVSGCRPGGERGCRFGDGKAPLGDADHEVVGVVLGCEQDVSVDPEEGHGG